MPRSSVQNPRATMAPCRRLAIARMRIRGGRAAAEGGVCRIGRDLLDSAARDVSEVRPVLDSDRRLKTCRGVFAASTPAYLVHCKRGGVAR